MNLRGRLVRVERALQPYLEWAQRTVDRLNDLFEQADAIRARQQQDPEYRLSWQEQDILYRHEQVSGLIEAARERMESDKKQGWRRAARRRRK